MKREDFIQKVCNRAMAVVHNMEESKDLNNVQAFIPINKKFKLEIDCERNEDDGTAFGFEFYVVEDENEIDGISSSCHYDDMRADITYLLNCWA